MTASVLLIEIMRRVAGGGGGGGRGGGGLHTISNE